MYNTVRNAISSARSRAAQSTSFFSTVSLQEAPETDFDMQDNKSWKRMFPASLVDMSFDVDDEIITLHDDGECSRPVSSTCMSFNVNDCVRCSMTVSDSAALSYIVYHA